MILAYMVVAGFMLLMALVGLIALPFFLFSIFGLFESFQVGSSGSRLLACIFFIGSAFTLAFSAYYLVPSLQLSREMWMGLLLVIAFPVLFIVGFAFFIRRSGDKND